MNDIGALLWCTDRPMPSQCIWPAANYTSIQGPDSYLTFVSHAKCVPITKTMFRLYREVSKPFLCLIIFKLLNYICVRFLETMTPNANCKHSNVSRDLISCGTMDEDFAWRLNNSSRITHGPNHILCVPIAATDRSCHNNRDMLMQSPWYLPALLRPG